MVNGYDLELHMAVDTTTSMPGENCFKTSSFGAQARYRLCAIRDICLQGAATNVSQTPVLEFLHTLSIFQLVGMVPNDAQYVGGAFTSSRACSGWPESRLPDIRGIVEGGMSGGYRSGLAGIFKSSTWVPVSRAIGRVV